MDGGFTADHADGYALPSAPDCSCAMVRITDPLRHAGVAEPYLSFTNTESHSIALP